MALDLPPGAPLVDVTCALGGQMDLSIDDTLVVVSAVGLHAYSGGLSYHQIRVLARQHNRKARVAPVAASVAFAESILVSTGETESTRDLLGLVGLGLATFGIGVLWRLLRPRAGLRAGSTG